MIGGGEVNSIIETERLLGRGCTAHPEGENFTGTGSHYALCNTQQRWSEVGLRWPQLVYDAREFKSGVQAKPRPQTFHCVPSSARIVSLRRCSAHRPQLHCVFYENEVDPTEYPRLLLFVPDWCSPLHRLSHPKAHETHTILLPHGRIVDRDYGHRSHLSLKVLQSRISKHASIGASTCTVSDGNLEAASWAKGRRYTDTIVLMLTNKDKPGLFLI